MIIFKTFTLSCLGTLYHVNSWKRRVAPIQFLGAGQEKPSHRLKQEWKACLSLSGSVKTCPSALGCASGFSQSKFLLNTLALLVGLSQTVLHFYLNSSAGWALIVLQHLLRVRNLGYVWKWDCFCGILYYELVNLETKIVKTTVLVQKNVFEPISLKIHLSLYMYFCTSSLHNRYNTKQTCVYLLFLFTPEAKKGC